MTHVLEYLRISYTLFERRLADTDPVQTVKPGFFSFL